jgi:type IV pilus assembly protein PilQ
VGKVVWVLAVLALASGVKRGEVRAADGRKNAEVPAAAEEGPSGWPRRYTGRPIDVDFKNADIREVLGILADVGGVLIVPRESLKVRVSIRMRNAAWQQVLDVLSRENNLTYDRDGKIIQIRKSARPVRR